MYFDSELCRLTHRIKKRAYCSGSHFMKSWSTLPKPSFLDRLASTKWLDVWTSAFSAKTGHFSRFLCKICKVWKLLTHRRIDILNADFCSEAAIIGSSRTGSGKNYRCILIDRYLTSRESEFANIDSTRILSWAFRFQIKWPVPLRNEETETLVTSYVLIRDL